MKKHKFISILFLLVWAVPVWGAAQEVSHLQQGFDLVRQGRCDMARPLIQRAMDKDPSLPGGWRALAYCAESQGQEEEALEFYRKAVLWHPQDAYSKNRMALLEPVPAGISEPVLSESRPLDKDPARAYFTLRGGAGLSRYLGGAFKKTSQTLENGYSQQGSPVQGSVSNSQAGWAYQGTFGARLSPKWILGFRFGKSRFGGLVSLSENHEENWGSGSWTYEGQMDMALNIQSYGVQLERELSLGKFILTPAAGFNVYSVEVTETARLTSTTVDSWGTDTDELQLDASAQGTGWGISLQMGGGLRLGRRGLISLNAQADIGSVSSLSGRWTMRESYEYYGATQTYEASGAAVFARHRDDESGEEMYILANPDFVTNDPELKAVGMTLSSLRLGLDLSWSL